jgi:hypothetical protein
MTRQRLAGDGCPPGAEGVARGGFGGGSPGVEAAAPATRQGIAGGGCPPGAGGVAPMTRQESGGDRSSPGVGGKALVPRRRFGGDGSSPSTAPVTRQRFDGGLPGAGAVSPESCPHCARRAVILRVVEGLQSKPPTRPQRAAAGAIVRGILACSCQADASPARQDLALPTPSRGNAMSLPRRAELPRRAAGAVPLRPIEVPFARAELQP